MPRSPETPDQMQAYLNQEEEMLRYMVRKVKDAGINVLLCYEVIKFKID